MYYKNVRMYTGIPIIIHGIHKKGASCYGITYFVRAWLRPHAIIIWNAIFFL